MKVVVIAELPDDCAEAWLEDLRDIEAMNPECRFRVRAMTSESIETALKALDIGPPASGGIKVVLPQ